MDNSIPNSLRTSRPLYQQFIALFMVFAMVLCMGLTLGADLGYCTGGSGGGGGAHGDAAENIQNAVNEGSTEVYKVMRAIVTPICIVLIGFAGFQFLIGGQQGTEKARKLIMAAGLGIAVVLLAPLFGEALATWFKDSADGDLSGFNPLA